MPGRFALLMTLALGAYDALSQEASWKVLPLATYRSGRYESVFFATPEIGWVVQIDGLIQKTMNGGITWNPQFYDFRANFRSIAFCRFVAWLGGLSQPAGALANDQWWNNLGAGWKPGQSSARRYLRHFGRERFGDLRLRKVRWARGRHQKCGWRTNLDFD